jgi:hypothetical protein
MPYESKLKPRVTAEEKRTARIRLLAVALVLLFGLGCVGLLLYAFINS